MNLDNRWGVSYNSILLPTLNVHMNVKMTSLIKFIKYVCKYITKGSNQSAFDLKKTNEVNEIKIYRCRQYIISSEVVWIIFGTFYTELLCRLRKKYITTIKHIFKIH